MSRVLTITLPDHVYHRLEVCAAKDEQRIAEGVEKLLTSIVEQYEEQKPPYIEGGNKCQEQQLPQPQQTH